MSNVAETTIEWASLLKEAYEGEIIGEAMYVTLEGLTADDDRHRTACQLLAELERITGVILLPVVTRHGIAFDWDRAWAEGEAFTRESIANGWKDYFAKVLPLAQSALAGMQRLHELSDETDQAAISALIGHEQAFLEFVRRELAEAPDSLEPLEQFLRAHEEFQTPRKQA